MTMLEKFEKANSEIKDLEKSIIEVENDRTFDWSDLKIKIIDDQRFGIEEVSSWMFIHRAFTKINKKYEASRIRGNKDDIVVAALKRCERNGKSRIYHFEYHPNGGSSDLSIYFKI